jgi:DNA modification methylase
VPAHWLATREIAIADLTRFPGNARRGNTGEIRKSIRRHGQYRAIVVRSHDGHLTILAGNHTADALAAEGHETARCELIECSDDEARRINAADNRLGELPDPETGERYDDEALAELLASFDGDFDGTGWTEDDLETLLEEDEPEQAGGGDPDDAPEPPAEPLSAPGDLYRLGPHRLLVGDCTDMAAVEAMLDGDRCDCMWTDPPYGVSYTGKTKDALTIQNDGAADLEGLLAGAWAVATAALKPGGAFYIAHPPGALYRTFGESVAQAGWTFRQGLVWAKNTMVLGHSDYHFKHEPIMFGYTAGAEGRRGRGGNGWYGDDSQVSVFMVDKPARNGEHPTMKPVELVRRMLANSCPPKGLVYEPFGGSGTTLIAAHELGCAARVCELDARYADVICRRFEEYAGITPERVLPDGTTVPVTFT